MIQFGEWLPDQADLDKPLLITAQNVSALAEAYAPFKSIEAYTSALPEACQWAALARSIAGNYSIYAGGQTALYKLNSTTFDWDDVSRVSGGSYNCPTDSYWESALFGDKLIVVNQNDNAQVIDISAGSNFEDLAGSPPRAKHVAVIGSFVLLGGLTDNPNRVQNSGLEDPEDWTTGGANFADYQDFPDGGFVTGFGGGDYGYVFQQGVTRRFLFNPSGTPAIEYEKIEDRGCTSPYSRVSVGQAVLYRSEEGFILLQGGVSQSISENKIDRWFKLVSNTQRLNSIQGAYDPINRQVIWAFTSTDNPQNTKDYALIYNLSVGRWTYAVAPLEYVVSLATQAVSLESLDAIYPDGIDSIPVSLDSDIFAGGVRGMAGFNTSHVMGFFSGANLEATIETGDMQLNQGGRAFVAGVTPRTDAATAYISTKSRARLQDSVVTSAETVTGVTGECPQRISSRYHRMKLRIPAGETWTYAQGLDVNARPDGLR
jgi:hypothetical protein